MFQPVSQRVGWQSKKLPAGVADGSDLDPTIHEREKKREY